MPGPRGRFSTVVKAKISELLDKPEDPAETLDYGYERQTELQSLDQQLGDALRSSS